MKVIVAVDSFKGSLSSLKVGEAIKIGIKKVFPSASIKIIPMGDGGEGTVEALVNATMGTFVTYEVTSPIGEPVESIVGILPNGTAVLEMASASGLVLVPQDKRNPLKATTWGTGELIRKVIDSGYKNILIGIGGSATNDGGAGMVQALGARLLDQEGRELPLGGEALINLKSIDLSDIDSRLSEINIKVMCDVTNPLCGPLGASYIYGPQKGATPEMIVTLEKSLENYARVIKEQLGVDVKDVPGAGAAGGLGAGLVAFTNAQLQNGVDTILDAIGFDELLPDYDIVISGEGRIDQQSIYGKLPIGVAKRALKFGKPVIAIVGSIGSGTEELYKHGLSSIISIANGPMSFTECMENAYELTVDAAERTFRIIKSSSCVF